MSTEKGRILARCQAVIRAILHPHIALLAILTPLSVAYLVICMVNLDEASALSISAYVISAYVLTAWCVRAPSLYKSIKNAYKSNIFLSYLSKNTRFRVNLTLYGAFLCNLAYAALQLGMGIYHSSFWFYSMAGYYLCLALMRGFLARYVTNRDPGQNAVAELKVYRACGGVLLVMNLAVALMVFFMVYFNRTFHHSVVTAIALAAYTFSAFTVAIINVIKYRKYNSYVYSATKAVSLAASCVSMLTLETTLLNTFGGDPDMRRTLLAVSGGAISVFIILLAIFMLVKSSKKLNQYKRG